MATMTVQQLINILSRVPNPQTTLVSVDDSVGTDMSSVDSSAVVSGGIDNEDGGTVDLVGEA